MLDAGVLLLPGAGALLALLVGTGARWRGRPTHGPLARLGARAAFAAYGALVGAAAYAAALLGDALVRPHATGGAEMAIPALAVVATGAGGLVAGARPGERLALAVGIGAVAVACALAVALLALLIDRAWGCGIVCV